MENTLTFLVENGRAWVKAQRELHRPIAEKLTPSYKIRLGPYFAPGILESARVHQVEYIENPDFYEMIEKAGQPIPMDFSRMAGITFVDTILIARPYVGSTDWSPLIFHECVHAAQYQFLGVDRFIEQYVRGWAENGFDYFSIPLEKQAYDLQRKFEANAELPFSVETEIALSLGTRQI